MKKYSMIAVFIFVIAACAAPPSISKEDQLATIVANMLTAQPVDSAPVDAATPIQPTAKQAVTFTPISTLTVTSTAEVHDVPTSHAAGPIYIFTRSQNVNLRVQPGTLFQVSRVMAQGTRLQVLGIAPGGEWAYVQNDEGINGWVGVAFVDSFPVEKFAQVEPGDVHVISGRVLDVNGLPVSGIGFAIEQGSFRTDAATDASGSFYAFLPKKYTGAWTVSFISISSTSSIMTPECMANIPACGKPDPANVSVTLPVAGQLNFVWK